MAFLRVRDVPPVFLYYLLLVYFPVRTRARLSNVLALTALRSLELGKGAVVELVALLHHRKDIRLVHLRSRARGNVQLLELVSKGLPLLPALRVRLPALRAAAVAREVLQLVRTLARCRGHVDAVELRGFGLVQIVRVLLVDSPHLVESVLDLLVLLPAH